MCGGKGRRGPLQGAAHADRGQRRGCFQDTDSRAQRRLSLLTGFPPGVNFVPIPFLTLIPLKLKLFGEADQANLRKGREGPCCVCVSGFERKFRPKVAKISANVDKEGL